MGRKEAVVRDPVFSESWFARSNLALPTRNVVSDEMRNAALRVFGKEFSYRQ